VGVLRFFILLIFLLLGCADLERNNPYDQDAVNYVGKDGGSSGSGDDIETSGTFTDDRDGKTYKWVSIGSSYRGYQKWMADNVNYNASGSVCFDNKTANCSKYGRLYDWATAGTACPSGWHLPSDAEWKKLTDFAGGIAEAGKKLKAPSGWDRDGNGTDNYGFAALPGGYGSTSSYGSTSFDKIEDEGWWWTADEYNSDYAHYRSMAYNSDDAAGYRRLKDYLHSVRCVKDD
jgi:uncharacterized protein (TIGR02145 family)